MFQNSTAFYLLQCLAKAMISGALCFAVGCGGSDEPAAETASSESTAETPVSADGEGAAAGMAAASMPPGGGYDSGSSGMAYSPPGAEASGQGSMSGMPGGYGAGMMPGGMAPGGMQMPGGSGIPGEGGITAPVVPVRPESVAMWSDQDLLDAVRDKDPRILDAIDARVQASPGDPLIGTMLTNLLTAVVTPPANPLNGSAVPGQSGVMSGYPGQGYPGAGGIGQGYPGAGSSGQGYPGAGSSAGPGAPAYPMPAPAGATPSGAAPRPGAAQPQSREPLVSTRQPSLRGPRSTNLAMDSLSIMVVESATAYFQGPGVGAMAGRSISVAPGASSAPNPADLYTPPAMAEGGSAEAAASAGAMPEYPGGAYPGNASGIGGADAVTSGGLDSVFLTERIIDALIRNGSPPAWKTLYGITAQTVKTPLAPTHATELVVRGLFRHIESNSAVIEPVLLSVIDGTAQIPPESRAVALGVMAEVSGAAADKLTGFESGAPVPGGFAASGQMGSGAMSAMQGMPGGAEPSGGYPGAAGAASGGYPGLAGAASGGYPGVAAGGYPGAASDGSGIAAGAASGIGAASGVGVVAGVGGQTISDAALTRSAKFLWSPKCVDALIKQIESSTDLGIGGGFIGGGDFVQIAASVPNDRVRQAVAALFLKCHATGVSSLSSVGLFLNRVHDPGMLVVLKSLPRPKVSRSTANAGQPVTLDTWTMAGQDLAISLRDRLRALSAKPGRMTPSGDSFPVRLHKNAIAEFSGMFTLPGTAGAALSESAPAITKVYYARTSFSPQRPKDQEEIADHYESRSSGVRRADQTKGILWMDGFKASQNGTKRSVDVFIEAATGGGGGQGFGGEAAAGGVAGFGAGIGGAGGASESFSIEIIVVETTDDKTAGDAKQASASSEKP